MIHMFDSVNIDTLPPNPEALAGYTSGWWPTYLPFVAKFPRLAKAGRIISIAVNVGHDADALDCEKGDATPDQVPAWVERQLARGLKRPIVYASVSQYSGVLSILSAHGISRDEIRVWTAHYTGVPHLCSSVCGFDSHADMTQYTDKAFSRNLDESLCEDTAFGMKVKPNPHYDWYYAEPKLNERPVVEEYDRLRDRPLSRIIPNRPKLKKLRAELAVLAQHAAYEARSHPNKDGSPSWQEFHRGFRHLRMAERAAGRRVI